MAKGKRRPATRSYYPPTPVQMIGGSGLQRGEPSGETYCPPRWATIAVMRCGEYQRANGCAAGCRNAVPTAEIATLGAAMRLADDEKPRAKKGRGSLICATCGGAKKSRISRCCYSCGNSYNKRLRGRPMRTRRK